MAEWVSSHPFPSVPEPGPLWTRLRLVVVLGGRSPLSDEACEERQRQQSAAQYRVVESFDVEPIAHLLLSIFADALNAGEAGTDAASHMFVKREPAFPSVCEGSFASGLEHTIGTAGEKLRGLTALIGVDPVVKGGCHPSLFSL